MAVMIQVMIMAIMTQIMVIMMMAAMIQAMVVMMMAVMIQVMAKMILTGMMIQQFFSDCFRRSSSHWLWEPHPLLQGKALKNPSTQVPKYLDQIRL